MKKIILTLSICLLFFNISCQAQIVSLETVAQCMQQNSNLPCPPFNYAKDINNSLDKYLGTWKGDYNGKTYELNFIKKINVGEDIKSDELVGRLRVSYNGQILYNTFDEVNDDNTKFRGLNFQPDLKAYMVYFVGTSPEGCINYGTVYLRINPINHNQMTIVYFPDNDIVQGECPNSFKPTFPKQQRIILTKQ